MATNTSHYSYLQILELLESDDELPFNFNDTDIMPAYENDNRFDQIQFKWVNKPKSSNNIQINEINSDSSESEPSNEDIKIPTRIIKNFNEPVTNNGVLTKLDLFCLKSIEGFAGDSTLIFLLNFLFHKDLQADYDFLKSCLVSINSSHEPNYYPYISSKEKTHRYKIFVKT